MSIRHWAEDLIGCPWVAGAEGPDQFNCWGLVRYVQREHYGIEVRAVSVDDVSHSAVLREFRHNDERSNWLPVDIPQDGDLVEMGSARQPHHIGVWLDVDHGGVLHCIEGHGVAFQSLAQLKLHGWGALHISRHRSKT